MASGAWQQSWQKWSAIGRGAIGTPYFLAAVGLVSAAVYALLWTRPTWLFDYSLRENAHALPDFLGLSNHGAVTYGRAVTVPFVLYLLALAAAHYSRSKLTVVIAIAGTVALPLALLFAYPSLAADIFDYMMSGRIIAEHGANPYVRIPADFSADPYYQAVGWKGYPTIYGPMFLWIAAVPMWVVGDHQVAGLITFKLIAIAAHTGTALLVYLTVKKLEPARAATALVAYGWNPMAVIFFGVDGHNDAIMLLFLSGAVYAAVCERYDVSLPLLTLSALVKYVPILLLPLFLLAALKHRRQLAIGVVVSALLTLAIFWPFWNGIDTFDGPRALGMKFTSSPAAVLRFIAPDDNLRMLLIAYFCAGYIATLSWVKGLTRRTQLVLTLYLVMISFWLKGWYLTWPLMIGCVVGGWPMAFAVAWSAGPFIQTLFGGWGWGLDWFSWQERWGEWMIELWLAGSLLAPLVLGLLVYAVVRLRNGDPSNPLRPVPEPPS